MVALSQTWKLATQQPPSAQITRQSPLQRKTSLATPIRMVLRARYFDPASGEFTSPDPLGYVDGFSHYRGYFVGVGSDPFGKCMIRVRPVTGPTAFPFKLKGVCGDTFAQSWAFDIPKPNMLASGTKTKGWLVQKVTVTCSIGECKNTEGAEFTLALPNPKKYKCKDQCECINEKEKTFSYFEAWRVNESGTRPINPPAVPKTGYDDTAHITTPITGSCGTYKQYGELAFFSEQVTGDLSTMKEWTQKPKVFYGAETGCGTTASLLHSFDGTKGKTPPFWNTVPEAAGRRHFEASWKCCCKDTSLNKASASADPTF